MKNKILYILSVCLLMFACTGEPDFSNIPEISFNNVRVLTVSSQGLLGVTKKDSVIMTVNFQDGDGDLGFTPDELIKLKKTTGDSLQTFVADIYVQRNGKFLRSNPREKFGGNVPIRFKQGSKAGPIEGTVDYSATFEYNVYQGIPYLKGKNDTIKFAIQIKDRALNRSNVVETTPVIIYAK